MIRCSEKKLLIQFGFRYIQQVFMFAFYTIPYFNGMMLVSFRSEVHIYEETVDKKKL